MGYYLLKMERWYSPGLDAKTARKLQEVKARIISPQFGIQNYEDNVRHDKEKGMPLELSFDLRLDNCNGVGYSTTDLKVIKEILSRTGARYVNNLEGKLINAHLNNALSYMEGISIDS